MAETDIKTPGKIASAGAPQGGTPEFMKPITEGQGQEGNAASVAAPAGAAAQTADPPKPATETKPTGEAPSQQPTDDEQLIKLFADKGITGFTDLEDLKAKLAKANTPAPVEPTAEEKAKQEQELEKRMLDHYTKHGGKVEDFVALKQLATADLRELSVQEIKRDMKAAGFDDGEIELLLKERYYQLNPDELPRLKTKVKDEDTGEEKDVDESDEDYNKRKAQFKKKFEYGSKRLENHAAPIKKQAEGVLAGLRNAVNTEDLLVQEEAKFSSKVDEYASKIPRKLSFDLGEIRNEKVDPVTYEVSEADIAEVVNTLKDPAKRQQFFYNQDNSLNLDNIGEIMLRNKFLTSALKTAYLEGGSREVAKVEKIFPGVSAHDIGVGGGSKGSQQGTPGKLAKAGTPQVGTPQAVAPKQ